MTIGIPTFNREARLTKAVASCRAQTYPNLEIVISDNASTDNTPVLCGEWGLSDERIVVIRQSHNLGRERNFGAVLRAASGEFFMWLSDDDWLEPEYVSKCAAKLIADPSYGMAGGTVSYFSPDSPSLVDAPATLASADPASRVLAYLATVYLNGTYSSLMRRNDAFRAEYPITLAGDWYFVAQMAALGKIAALPDAVLHRSAVGGSSDMSTLPLDYGMSSRWGQDVHLWTLILVVPALARGRSAFGLIPTRRRIPVALNLSSVLIRRWWRRSGRQRVASTGLARLRRRVLGRSQEIS